MYSYETNRKVRVLKNGMHSTFVCVLSLLHQTNLPPIKEAMLPTFGVPLLRPKEVARPALGELWLVKR